MKEQELASAPLMGATTKEKAQSDYVTTKEESQVSLPHIPFLLFIKI